MCKGVSIYCILAFILAIASFVFDLIGFSAPYWLSSEQTLTTYFVRRTYGLWQGCTTIGSSRTCSLYSTKTSAFEAAEAFETIGFLLLLGTLVCFVLYMFVLKAKEKLRLITMIVCFVDFFVVLLGLIIFGANTDDFGLTSDNLHFAFAFCLIASVLILASGIILLVEKLMEKKKATVDAKA